MKLMSAVRFEGSSLFEKKNNQMDVVCLLFHPFEGHNKIYFLFVFPFYCRTGRLWLKYTRTAFFFLPQLLVFGVNVSLFRLANFTKVAAHASATIFPKRPWPGENKPPPNKIEKQQLRHGTSASSSGYCQYARWPAYVLSSGQGEKEEDALLFLRFKGKREAALVKKNRTATPR